MNKTHYLWCLIVAGIIGMIFHLNQSANVFPSASIELKTSRQQIAEKARKWARTVGYNPDARITSTIFSLDDDAKTFLEYELGSAKANALMRDAIPVWYWSTRFCEELKQPEFVTFISPTGSLVSLEYQLENDRVMPNIDHSAARKLAEEFISRQTELKLTDFRLEEDGTIAQPHRIDHYFTWERVGQDYAGAKMRIYTYVAGNSLTTYTYFLHISDEWKRKFNHLRSFNQALADIAEIAYNALNTGTFFVFLWGLQSRQIRWRFPLAVALVYAAMDAIETVNGLPGIMHEYKTTMPFRSFVIDTSVNALVAVVWTFVQVLLLTAAADMVYRLTFPKHVAVEKYFTRAGLATQSFLKENMSGLATAGVHLGWVVLFYLVGRKMGFWVPLEIQNAETLSSTLPFFSAMDIGWSAALNEELMYRVLGMAFMLKLTGGRFWLANLSQAAAWAFMHSTYPQEPPYARGLELTFVGVMYGLIMKRFGILACFIAHNAVDTYLGVAPLFSSPVLSYQIGAWIAMTPFLTTIVAGIGLRRSSPAEESALLNETLITRPHVPLPDEAPRTYSYKPLATTVRVTLLSLIVASSAVQFGYKLPLLFRESKIGIRRDEAVDIARKILQEHGVDPSSYSCAAWSTRLVDGEAFQYIREKERRRLTDLSKTAVDPVVWQVRFFKALVQREYLIKLRSDGALRSFEFVVPEKEPGARATQEQARAVAEEFLNAHIPEVRPYTLSDQTETRRDARNDHTFEFKVPKFKVDEADYVVSATTTGGEISSADRGWIIPDKWTFERRIIRPREQFFSYVVWFLTGISSVLGVIWATGVVRSGAIPWRAAFIIGLCMSVIPLTKTLNDLPNFFVGYSTDTPLSSYFVAQGVNPFRTIILSVGSIGVLAAFGLAALKLLLPDASVKTIVREILDKRANNHMNLWIDGVLAGYAGGITQKALQTLWSAAHEKFSPVITMAPLSDMTYLANLTFAWLDVSADAIWWGTYYLFIAAVLVGMYAKFVRSPLRYATIAVAVSLLFPAPERYLEDYVLGAINSLISFAFSWLFITRLARSNLLAYWFAGATGVMAGYMRTMITQDAKYFAADIAVLLVLLLLPLVYANWQWLKKLSKESGKL